MIEEDVYSVLAAASAVTALVGDHISVYPLPQSPVYPCVGYQVEEQQQASDYDGQGDFGEVEIQIDNWADTYVAAKSLGEAVSGVLKNYRGLFGATQVWQITLDANVTVFDQNAGQEGKFRNSQVYTLLR